VNSGLHATRQQRLLATLGCIRCHAALEVRSPRLVGDAVAHAELVCSRCGALDVWIEDYQVVSLPHLLRAGSKEELRVALPLSRLEASGTWHRAGGTLIAQPAGTIGSLSYRGPCSRVEVGVVHGPWGGKFDVVIDGHVVTTYDSYGPIDGATSVCEAVTTPGVHLVEVVAGGTRSTVSAGAQVAIRDMAVTIPMGLAPSPTAVAVNHGNPYPPRFLELIDEADPEAVIIDCGGGDRRVGDERVYNLEYGRMSTVDIAADCELLPLQDGTVDLLLSQAVLEHVLHPAVAAAEILRVLRPGGVAFIEAAYMQPFHPVPNHYFNITPSGLKLLFDEADERGSGVFGTLEETLRWLCGIVGAAHPGWGDSAPLLAAARQLDEAAGATVLRHFASAAWIEISKP
jgi:hypothetical protein